MCRYSYLSGACANRHIDSLECIGLDKCEFSGLNVLTGTRFPLGKVECGHEQWLGLYCERYQRFFCPGRENCATPESYQKNLTMYEERKQRLAGGP